MLSTILQGTIFSMPEGLSKEEYSKYVKNWIRPYLQVVYQHPECKFFFYISGIVFEYLQRHFKECLDVLYDLSARSQIELLNGMYFDAAPGLQTRVDQKEQLEQLSHYIRANNLESIPSKCAWLMSGTFEHNIIKSLHEHGARHLLIDRAYLEPVPELYSLGLVELLGTKLIMLPYEELSSEYLEDKNFVDTIYNNLHQLQSNKVIVLLTKYSSSIDTTSYFQKFDEMLTKFKEKQIDKLSTLPSKIGKFDEFPIENCRIRTAPYGVVNYNSFFNSILSRSESRMLYSYFLYIMKQISLYKNQDKDRKQSARMAIRHLQNHFAFWRYNDEWGIQNNHIRQHAYQALSAIEKSLKNKSTSKTKKIPSIVLSRVDFNMNGEDEFLVSSQNATIVVEQNYASVIMLLRKAKQWNYLSCYNPYDKPQSFPSAFREIILTQDSNITEIHEGILANNSQYSLVEYGEHKSNSPQASIISYSTDNKPLKIQKQYLFSAHNSNTMQINYQFSNVRDNADTESSLEIMLVVEINLSFLSATATHLEIAVDEETVSAEHLVQVEGNTIVMSNRENKEKLIVELPEKTGVSLSPVYGTGDIKNNNMYQHHSVLLYQPITILPNSFETFGVHLSFANITKTKQ